MKDNNVVEVRIPMPNPASLGEVRGELFFDGVPTGIKITKILTTDDLIQLHLFEEHADHPTQTYIIGSTNVKACHAK